ncbi:hypothetical protein OSTOST_00316, partial [Ostertagia ostertagi]
MYLKAVQFENSTVFRDTVVKTFSSIEREDFANYRPISLLSVIYKTFTKILLNRMERTLDEYQPVEQTGFRKNFSCMDNIQAVTQLIERKAFDSVEINAVLNALTQAGVLPAYIHLLEQCFSNTSTTIQLFDQMINELNVEGLKIGLEMNMSKTQMMVNQWSDMGEVKLAGIALQRVESYVYLGKELNMTNNIVSEIHRRKRAAWTAFGSIREVTDQVNDPELKACIFNTSVLPAMYFATRINAVLNALTQAGVLPAYIHLLEQCFSNTSTTIQLFDRKLKIPIEKG